MSKFQCLPRDGHKDDAVFRQAMIALHSLEHMTSDEFSKGGDRVARVALALIADATGVLDSEHIREYLRV